MNIRTYRDAQFLVFHATRAIAGNASEFQVRYKPDDIMTAFHRLHRRLERTDNKYVRRTLKKDAQFLWDQGHNLRMLLEQS